MRLEFQDNIDRYLLNRMSEEERTAFEEKCANNPELKEQLEHTQEVKAAISERSKMVERIQSWDDEYEKEIKISARKKRVAIYWTSGIAAAFVMGYFLFQSTDKTESEGRGNLVAMNLDGSDVSSAEQTVDSLAKSKDESEKLLAQNDVDMRRPNKGVNSIYEEQVMSFGKGDFKTASPQRTNGYEDELRKIREEKELVIDKIAELGSQLNSGSIDKDVYGSMIYLLNYQRDNLSWREAQVLLKLNREEKALTILRKMKNSEGEFQNKADSLYKATINNE